MEAKETRLKSLLEGTKQYIIPLFQRQYNWGQKQWKQLFEDIIELADNSNSTEKEHFMGSIVTMPIAKPEEVSKFLVIDGQQRMITFFIFLCALRDKGIKLDKFPNKIEDTYLFNSYYEDTDYYKLIPTQGDRNSFYEILRLNPCKGDEVGNQIVKAYNYFSNQIDTKSPDLPKLLNVFINYFFIVSITLNESDNPYRIFESLNATGLPLAQSDLIRNYFFMRIQGKNQQEDIYQNIWKPMQDTFNKYDTENDKGKTFSDFIRHFLMREGRDIKEIDSITFAEVCKVVENFILRRFICGIPTNQLNKIFPSLYKNLDKSSLVESLKINLCERNYPTDAKFRFNFPSTSLYNRGKEDKARLILETLEQVHGHKESSISDNISVEHIMPQTLTKQWKEYLGKNWSEIYDNYLHTIGNLTLTGYNAEMSNYSYAIKKIEIEKSHFEINKYFSNVPSWDEYSIKERARVLTELALICWPSLWGNKEPKEVITSQITSEVTGTKPSTLIILNSKINVSTWKEVLIKTLENIYILDEDKFIDLVEDFPNRINYEPEKFRSAYRLNNDYYIEVNLSADAIKNFCLQVLKKVELTEEDWKVEFKQKV